MSLPRYPEYKDSGVEWLGEVPAHWTVDALRRRASLNPSKSEIGELPDDALVSFLPMEAVGERGELDLSRTRQISDVLSGYTYFREGDVTFAKITPCFENGKGARMVGLHGGCGFGTTELTVARPNSDLLDSHYLDWVFRSTPFRKRGEAAMYGAGGQKRVPDEFVRKFVFGWPDVDEQISIARFLDRETARIDALIAEQKTLLELLAEKRQATISHAVTRGLDPNVPMKDSGIAWLGDIPAHWTTPPLRLRYACDLGKMLDSSKISGSHLVPYLRNVDVQWDAVNSEGLPEMDISEAEYERYTVQSGDLLVCEGGELGRAALVTRVDGVVGYQKALHRLRALEADENPRYMFYTLAWAAKRGVFDGGGQATIAHLTGEQLRAFRFPRPSKPEQDRIVERLNAELGTLELLRKDAESAIQLLRERRSTLISAAVTGQIDVRGLVSEAAA